MIAAPGSRTPAEDAGRFGLPLGALRARIVDGQDCVLPDHRMNGVFQVASGHVKRLVQKRGYGFIEPHDADEEILFYRSGVEGDAFEQLRVGQRVEFDQEPDPREPGRQRAIHVLLWQE